MKKIIGIAAVFVLCFALLSVCVFAAEPEPNGQLTVTVMKDSEANVSVNYTLLNEGGTELNSGICGTLPITYVNDTAKVKVTVTTEETLREVVLGGNLYNAPENETVKNGLGGEGKSYTFDLGSISDNIELTLNYTDTPVNNNNNDPNQQDKATETAQTGQVAINIVNARSGIVEYAIGSGSGWQQFDGGILNDSALTNGAVVYLKATASGGQALDTYDGQNNIKIDNAAATNIDYNQLENGTYSFTFDSAKAYTLQIKFEPYREEQQSDFDGTAYFFWQGSNGVTYYKEFNDLIPSNSGDNFVVDSTIVSQDDPDVHYVFGQNFEWVSKGTFDANVNNEYSPMWTLFDIEDENELHQYTMDPTTNSIGNHSAVVTPDRAFRIAIIDEDYQAITVDSGAMHFPKCSYNDTVFGIPYIDISDTEKDNPADVKVFLSEDKVVLGAETLSHVSNTITSVKALDVAENCVSVTDKGNGKFEIEFHSNFYDKVVFEVKDSENRIFYIRIVRTAITMADNFSPEQQHPAVTVHYTYEASTATRTGNIPDFQMVATVRYDDGTSEIKIVNPEIVFDKDGSSTQQYEMTSENEPNLRICQFSVDCPDTVKSISVSVQRKAEAEKFAGALVGSGEGVTFDVESREVVY